MNRSQPSWPMTRIKLFHTLLIYVIQGNQVWVLLHPFWNFGINHVYPVSYCLKVVWNREKENKKSWTTCCVLLCVVYVTLYTSPKLIMKSQFMRFNQLNTLVLQNMLYMESGQKKRRLWVDMCIWIWLISNSAKLLIKVSFLAICHQTSKLKIGIVIFHHFIHLIAIKLPIITGFELNCYILDEYTHFWMNICIIFHVPWLHHFNICR